MSSKIKTAWHSSRTSRTSRTAKDELSVVLDFSQNLDVPNDSKEKPGPGPTCNYYYSSHGHGKNCSDILASSITGEVRERYMGGGGLRRIYGVHKR